jgi:hypothetical protein
MREVAAIGEPFRRRAILLVQLLGTAGALGWLPGNIAKLGAMALIWIIGFGRISRSELILMASINILFAFLNFGALKSGIFRFSRPDFLGMPVYEFLMWGYYCLHVLRMIGARPSPKPLPLVIAMAVVFALPFSTISDPQTLLLASGAILLLSLIVFHEPVDLAYAGYMLAVGALIEYVGVWTGQWTYPLHPSGGVPLWFATMWAGVGLFTGRLLSPISFRPRREAIDTSNSWAQR